MSSREQIDSIIRQVQTWPTEERVALAYEILREMRLKSLEPAPRSTFALASGMLRTNRPPPTDEEVERWVEEHRMHKYGQR